MTANDPPAKSSGSGDPKEAVTATPRRTDEELLSLAAGLDAPGCQRVFERLSQCGVHTVETAITAAHDAAVRKAISDGLELCDQVVLGTLFNRATARVDDKDGKKQVEDLALHLVAMTDKYGSSPDASLVTSRTTVISKMRRVTDALTMNLEEFSPALDGAKRGSKHKLTVTDNLDLVTTEEVSPKSKITDFSSFTTCFLRWMTMFVAMHPPKTDSKNVTFVDFLIYFRRLTDLLPALKLEGVISYDLRYREAVAILHASGRISLSGAFREDASPTTLGSALADATISKVTGNRGRQDHKPRGKRGVCFHFLEGNCDRGDKCRFAHTLDDRKTSSASRTGPYSRPEPQANKKLDSKRHSGALTPHDKRAPGSHEPNCGDPHKPWLIDFAPQIDELHSFQDGSGISARLPSPCPEPAHPSPEEILLLSQMDEVVKSFQLEHLVYESLGPDGRIRDAMIPQLSDAFDNAATSLRKNITDVLPSFHSNKASVGGPLYPDMVRLITELLDEGRDPKLAQELDRGVSMGISSDLSVSGVFPARDTRTADSLPEPLHTNPFYDNYSSAREASDAVEELVEKELLLGRVRTLSAEEAADGRVFSKLAAIPKKLDDSGCPVAYRLVEDLKKSGTNSCINLHERVTLPSLSDLVSLIKRMSYDDEGVYVPHMGAVADIEGAYRHLYIDPQDRSYCCFKTRDAYFENLAMPFGAPSSCWNFCRLSSKMLRSQHKLAELLEFWLKELAKKRVRSVPAARGLIYIDDSAWLLAAALALPILVRILLLLPLVGLSIAWNKCILLTQRFKFIGYEVDISREFPHIHIPIDKLEKISEGLRSIMRRDIPCSVKLIEQVAGKLNWVSMACPFTRPYLASLYSALKMANRKGLKSLRISESSALFEAASWWLNVIESDNAPSRDPFRLNLPILPPKDRDAISLASDASTTGLGGWAARGNRVVWYRLDIVETANLGSFRELLTFNNKALSDDMVVLETIAAAMTLRMGLQFFDRCISNRTPFTFYSDNSGTVAALRKLKSKTPRVNAILKKAAGDLAKVCYQWSVDYIPSEENKAADLISHKPTAADASLKGGSRKEMRRLATGFICETKHDMLADNINRFIRSGHSTSTIQQYDSVESFYREVVSAALEPFPVTGRSVALFTMSMCNAGYKYSTISSYISSISTRNSSYGYSLSKLDEFQIKMARRAAAKLTTDETKQMRPLSRLQVIKIGELDHALRGDNTTAILTGVFGMLRPDELLALNVGDVTIESTLEVKAITLSIRESKTDQAGRGEEVVISCVENHPDSDDCVPYCAYHRLLRKQHLLPADGSRTSPLQELPLFTNGGERITYEDLMKDFRAMLTEIGVSSVDADEYGLHSLRRTGCQLCFDAGVRKHTMMEHGR
ncbi:hypothetical protein FOL47_000870 [Perkinsus chesapeaki]|uniref:C3H1-type domain-containing protein n=1 Tax=Perkinsus chesapeaki TaxID=330153 RepID=A0A7J6KWE0_PERCH|nr:hypothetical protein FOL47_000870 [Perkinsus chesapeaki]